MTIKYLKKGKNDSDKALEDASVSETVKNTFPNHSQSSFNNIVNYIYIYLFSF